MQTKQPIKFGLIHPSPHHYSFIKGAQLAQNEINNSGGVRGRQIECVHRFNRKYQGKFPSLAATKKVSELLIEKDEVIAVLGPAFSINGSQIRATIRVPKVPEMPADRINIAVGVPNDFHARYLSEFAFSRLKAKTVAVIHQEKSRYAEGYSNSFKKRFLELGGTIRPPETYRRNDTSFDLQLIKVVATKPDILVISGFAPEVPLIIKQAREMEITSKILGGSRWVDQDLFLDTLSDHRVFKDCRWTAELYNTDDKYSLIQNFIKDYRKEYGILPDRVAAVGYDVLKDASSSNQKR